MAMQNDRNLHFDGFIDWFRPQHYRLSDMLVRVKVIVVFYTFYASFQHELSL